MDSAAGCAWLTSQKLRIGLHGHACSVQLAASSEHKQHNGPVRRCSRAGRLMRGSSKACLDNRVAASHWA